MFMFLIDCSVVQTTQFLIINLNLIEFIFLKKKIKFISDLLAALTMHGLYKCLKFIKHLTF